MPRVEESFRSRRHDFIELSIDEEEKEVLNISKVVKCPPLMYKKNKTSLLNIKLEPIPTKRTIFSLICLLLLFTLKVKLRSKPVSKHHN